jgi:predicted DsbA family dithiol-disulfide isomerase
VIPIALVYVTDPACPASWAREPALRALGPDVEVRYVMAGLARTVDPVAMLRDWLEAGATSGMPVDGRLWLSDPPKSTYPACLAVKAAGEQGLDGVFLRRVREGFAVRRLKLDTADALLGVAREVPGLDVERFRIDLQSNAIVEAFGADLELARLGSGGVPRWEPPDPPRAAPLGVEDALRAFGPMATPEVAAVCDLPGPRAPAELWRLALEWRVRHDAGLWTLA